MRNLLYHWVRKIIVKLLRKVRKGTVYGENIMTEIHRVSFLITLHLPDITKFCSNKEKAYFNRNSYITLKILEVV